MNVRYPDADFVKGASLALLVVLPLWVVAGSWAWEQLPASHPASTASYLGNSQPFEALMSPAEER